MGMNQLIQSGDQGKIKILFHNNISSSYGTLGTVKTLFIGPGVGVFRKSFIHKNCSQNHGTGLVKSYTQKLIKNGNNSEDENSRKTSVTKPNIKELTNKQRNWFSSFEESQKESNGNEPIDSVRRSR